MRLDVAPILLSFVACAAACRRRPDDAPKADPAVATSAAAKTTTTPEAICARVTPRYRAHVYALAGLDPSTADKPPPNDLFTYCVDQMRTAQKDGTFDCYARAYAVALDVEAQADVVWDVVPVLYCDGEHVPFAFHAEDLPGAVDPATSAFTPRHDDAMAKCEHALFSPGVTPQKFDCIGRCGFRAKTLDQVEDCCTRACE